MVVVVLCVVLELGEAPVEGGRDDIIGVVDGEGGMVLGVKWV